MVPPSSGPKNRQVQLACYLFHVAFFLGLYFGPEDGSNINAGWLSTDYKTEFFMITVMRISDPTCDLTL
jgi:hypothetical protein